MHKGIARFENLRQVLLIDFTDNSTGNTSSSRVRTSFTYHKLRPTVMPKQPQSICFALFPHLFSFISCSFSWLHGRGNIQIGCTPTPRSTVHSPDHLTCSQCIGNQYSCSRAHCNRASAWCCFISGRSIYLQFRPSISCRSRCIERFLTL
jgi:hypothetical protein